MNKNDLRFKKTELSLRSAFISLLEDKDWQDITIKELCEKAVCSRNTFYLHYAYKDELYLSILNETMQSIEDVFEPEFSNFNQQNDEVNRIYTTKIINCIIEHQDILAILIKRDDGTFFKKFHETIQKKCDDSIQTLLLDKEQAFPQATRFYTAYLSSAVTGFIFEWFQQAMPIQPDQAKDWLFAIHNQTINVCNQSFLGQ